VSAGTGAANVADFFKAAKANPKKYSFGSYGVATTAHLFGETMNRRAGLDMAHIPYKGEAPAVQDLLGGQVTAVFGTVGVVDPHVKAGKVRIIAFASPKRVAGYPDVPTFAEAGLPEINLPGWIGVLAPAGTPRAILDKVAEQIGLVMRLPDVAQRMAELGYIATGTTPAQFNEQLAGELGKWAELGKETGISLD
jgi:tripartite-type tricarboxylate transporter receptor subunit TctC